MSSTTWVTAALLQALADEGAKAGFEFCTLQLNVYQALKPLSAEQRVHATTKLCGLGFLKHRVERWDAGDGSDYPVTVYTVTADGAAAIEAARQGHMRRSGPKTTRGPAKAKPEAFSTRLWNLMRMRKMLTPAEGAELLCDANADDFETRRATARKCLRRWASTGALAESARRIGPQGHSNGDKRYVLLLDTVEPPRWREPATQADKRAARAGKEAA